jgi:hypothetical protein
MKHFFWNVSRFYFGGPGGVAGIELRVQRLQPCVEIVSHLVLRHHDKINIAVMGVEIAQVQRPIQIHAEKLAFQDRPGACCEMVQNGIYIREGGWTDVLAHFFSGTLTCTVPFFANSVLSGYLSFFNPVLDI